jgi:hypothetical protein
LSPTIAALISREAIFKTNMEDKSEAFYRTIQQTHGEIAIEAATGNLDEFRAT